MTTSIEKENNPLLNWLERPAYDKITPDHVVPAVEVLLAESEQAIHDIEQDPPITWQGLFPRLEQIEDKLTRTWSLVGHLNGVRNSPELREAYMQVQPKLVAFANRMGQSAEIYQSLDAIKKNEGNSLNKVQTRILESALRDAQMSGVGLEGEQKARYNEIAARMAELNTKFSNNVLDAVKAYVKILTTAEETAGLPDSFLAMAAETARGKGHEEATAESGPWAITLDYPSYGPAMKYSSVRALRQELNHAYMTRATEGDLNNAPIVTEILQLRQEQAELLGFDNYAQVSMNRKMATWKGLKNYSTTCSTHQAKLARPTLPNSKHSPKAQVPQKGTTSNHGTTAIGQRSSAKKNMR